MNSNQQFQPSPNMGSGLTRYRSAPSSYFASLDDGGFGADDFAELFNPQASSPETQIIFSRFMNGGAAVEGNFAAAPPRELEAEEYQPPQKLQRNHSNDYSMNSNCAAQAKMESGGSGNSGLIRHSSLPAGFLANISIENEFKTTSGVGSYGGGRNANAEASFSSTSRRMDYSSTGMLDPISTAVKNAAVGDEDHDFMTNLPWNDSAFLSDHYLKGVGENANKRFALKQEEEAPKTKLSHHLSLPKSLAMEKLLQDSVPCKIRAKRGFATHPRSIAERVRRTKISERIRKLQELVPNMEKQTNTSDMLDLAVDYIKELQGQVKTLSDNHTKCNCSAKQR